MLVAMTKSNRHNELDIGELAVPVFYRTGSNAFA